MLAQIEQARVSAMARGSAWDFEINELTAFVSMHREKGADTRYLLRIRFDDFDRRAPSYVFVNAETREPDAAAWPPNVMHSEWKICTPGTREFHEEIHQNDAQYVWDSNKYTVIATLRMIQRLMDS